ncbi:MAG: DUF4249 domain-containing protein [Muribaculaceae bacterium]|jgi:hypothetical protein|nr:DUF4249 domain-containing protein [Muribaculaceae bacterium]
MLPHLTTILFLLLLLCSCDSYFEPECPDTDEKTVLYCMPSPDTDTVLIQLSRSVPLSSSGTPPKGIPGADIDFRINGTLHPVQWNEKATPSLPAECYYVCSHVNEGDRIEIMASTDGIAPVSAFTVIPPPFPLNHISFGLKPGISPQLQIRINFTDDASSVDYYGVRVCRMNVSGADSTETVLKPGLTDEPLLNHKVGIDATFDLDYNYYQDLYIWSDEQVQGKEYTLRLNVDYIPDTPEESGQAASGEKHLYKVALYTLSSELYHYLKSVNDISNNELGQNGLAPIRSHYTNITNGFGVLGGCQYYDSGWLSPHL